MANQFLLGLIWVITFGIGAQWLAWRTKLPGILLLLIAGLVAGPVTGLLDPDLLMGDLLGPFISVSVGIILFEGGLSLKFSELREIGGSVTKLVSIGVICTLILTSVSAYYLFGMSVELAVLLGAILVVTGPTVVIPLLRQVRPTTQVSNVLKWEGIVIDPIGAMLAVLVFEVIFTSSFSEATSLALLSIGKTVFFGSIIGLAGAGIIFVLIKNFWLPDFLQNPVTLMFVVIAFGASNFIQHESGLWATTVMGIALANQKSARIHHIVEFKENLRVLLLSALFILLAARVELSALIDNLNWQILGFLAVLIFVARPLSVYLSTLGSNLNWKEKIFISWMAPRGVVAASIASLFALELVENGYEEAAQIVPIVFIVIISTVAIYGLTANAVARGLKVAKPSPHGFLFIGAHEWAREIAKLLKQEGYRVLLTDTNRSNIRQAKSADLDTHYGNILGEHTMEEINLDGIGNVVALTPNDEVNSLSIIQFAEFFNSSSLYQLQPPIKSQTKDREVPDNLTGRKLFSEDLRYKAISTILNNNGSLEIVEIDDEAAVERFTADEERKHAIPLFLLRGSEEAIPYSLDNSPDPQVGDKMICLMNPEIKPEAV